MESLSSSFLAIHPQLLNVQSFRSNVRMPQGPQPKQLIITYSSLTAFHPLEKLVKQISQTLETLKNPTPPHQNDLIEKKNKKQSLLDIIFNTLDDFICKSIDLPLRRSIDPKHVLADNHAPVVDEFPPTTCDVVLGSLPSCLNGAYIRNGPNPQFFPKGPYHFLDGDGMLHMIKISQGKPTFCSRYVKTYKYTVESEIGYPIFPSVFSSFNGLAASTARFMLILARAITRPLDPLSHGCGTANTNLALFSGRLFALCESDLPYGVKITPEGDIITLGRHDFGNKESFLRMTAHPKIDRETGEVFAYKYDVTSPFLTFFRIDSDGRKQKDVAIYSVKGFTAIHDFAVTKHYAIFPDLQIVVNHLWVLSGKSPVGVDLAKAPRLGVMPKYAEDESGMWWIDAPGLNLLHCVNAWEEDDGNTITVLGSNVVMVEEIFENVESSQFRLEKIIIDVKGKSLQRHPLSMEVLDFPVINPAYAAKKNRYVYAAVIGPTSWLGVVKLDLTPASEVGSDCMVASRLYGPGWSGGEPFFVPKEPNNPEAEEDDGYLVTYVHDDNSDESKFLVMDAKSPNLDIVAAVKLPRRVPNGFHGIFVPEIDLNRL